MRRSIPRISRLAAALAALLLCVSCVDLRADLQVAADGSARLKLRYAVSKIVVSLEALSAEEPLLPFPLTRQGFETSAAAAPGATLVSYSQVETRDDLVTEAELAFESMPSFVAFLDPTGSRASYAEPGSAKTLSILIWPGSPSKTGLDADLVKFVDAAFAPYAVALTIGLPRKPVAAGIGRLGGDGASVQYGATMAELARSQGPVEWAIRW
jgi:hypothetical protein